MQLMSTCSVHCRLKRHKCTLFQFNFPAFCPDSFVMTHQRLTFVGPRDYYGDLIERNTKLLGHAALVVPSMPALHETSCTRLEVAVRSGAFLTTKELVTALELEHCQGCHQPSLALCKRKVPAAVLRRLQPMPVSRAPVATSSASTAPRDSSLFLHIAAMSGTSETEMQMTSCVMGCSAITTPSPQCFLEVPFFRQPSHTLDAHVSHSVELSIMRRVGRCA